MMVWICTACTTAYSVGAPQCPHCGTTDRVEAGSAEHLAWLDARTKPAKKATSGRDGNG